MIRPTSLTVVAWLLIVLGILALLSMAVSYDELYGSFYSSFGARIRPLPYLLPVWAMFAFGVIDSVVNIVVGIAILVGREWSRKAYVVINVLFYAVMFGRLSYMRGAISSATLVMVAPSALLTVLFFYLLFRRSATKHFRQARTSEVF